MKTGNRFIVIIDEWDCIFRENRNNSELQEEYVTFLRSLFKGQASDTFLALGYITGILPIRKYGTQSALNNFSEKTMIDSDGIAEYVGFTEKEVMGLCEKYDMPFPEMRKWYDGYFLENVGHVYCPNSVVNAIRDRTFGGYWSRTDTFEALVPYIMMDFEGLREKITRLIAGERIRIKTDSFRNTMNDIHSADDVLTLFVHLGYLGYDKARSEAFIPNHEVRGELVNAAEAGGWKDVVGAISRSEELLAATWALDGDKVASSVEETHRRTRHSLEYNSEASLSSVVQLSYYSAMNIYTVVRELPTGDGFADIAFIPKPGTDRPALLVELKRDRSAEEAIAQIRERHYSDALEAYRDNLLLVAISYDSRTKKHQCIIEKA